MTKHASSLFTCVYTAYGSGFVVILLLDALKDSLTGGHMSSQRLISLYLTGEKMYDKTI